MTSGERPDWLVNWVTEASGGDLSFEVDGGTRAVPGLRPVQWH